MTDISYRVASGALPAYLAVPDGTGPWPGVVVLHEVFGLTDDIRKQADRFAERGYLALAPDLFGWGNTVRCLATSFRTMLKGDGGRIFDDIDGARRFLVDRDDCTGSVGVIGFCFGGGFALLTAPSGFAVSAPNYGHLPRHPSKRLAGSCPTVASYGARDPQLRGSAAKLDAVLTQLDVEHDVKEYPTAKHGFLFRHTGRQSWTEPLAVAYDAAAADDAWQRIFTFFDRHLRKDV